MSNPLEQQAETIIGRMLELPEGDRAAAAALACGRNGELLRRVMSLLSAAPLTVGFMDAPAVPPSAGLHSFAPIGEKPGDTIGRYKLLEQIGEGGFGVVFMAEQLKPVRRRVALKVIKLGMDTREVVARFEAERQALAMMDHPNIARVLDAGATDTGRPYFAMELVRGSPVTEYADKHKLSTRERVAVAAQICRAVQHAHSKGVIHRDIKPSNVLVTVADDKPVPKVIDFGIAKATQAKLTDRTLFTSHRQLIGTPQYMSPEQADSDGSDIDTRTDVYSLGVLIYELLVGTTPLDAKSLRSAAYEAMRKMIFETEPPKLTTRLSGLGETLATVATNRSTDAKHLSRQLRGELEWIVMRALEKDRSRRYDTAAALADDLGRYLSGEAVLAGPVSGVYRLRKTLRRYKAAVVLGAVITACLLLGVAGTTLGLVREAKQRKIADAQRADAVAQRADADRQRIVATDQKAVALTARSQAEAAAMIADRAAALSDARYLIQQGQLPDATDRMRKAEALGSQYEDGLVGRDLVLMAQANWHLVRRFNPFGHRPTVACMTYTDAGEVYLVTTDEHHLVGSSTDNDTAAPGDRLEADIAPKLLASTITDHVQNKVVKLDPGTVVAADGLEVRAYAVAPLRQLAARRFPSPVVNLTTSATSALLLHDDGTLRLIDAHTLVDIQTWDVTKLPSNINSDSRTQCVVSPDDRFVVIHSAPWLNPTVAIDRTKGTIFAKVIQVGPVAISPSAPTELLSWFAVDPLTGETQVLVNDLADQLRDLGAYASSRDITKNRLGLQAGANGGILSIGSVGLATAGLRRNYAARYLTLWPYPDQHPRCLATNAPSARIALATDIGEVLVFQPGPAYHQFKLDEGTACATEAGILTADSRDLKNGFVHGAVSIRCHPFDPAQPAWSAPLQWLVPNETRKDVYADGTSATPDGHRVAVLAQESIGGSNVAATFLRKVVILYEPGDTALTGQPPADGTDPWRIVRRFDLPPAAGMSPFNNRAFRLSADGRRIIYATQSGDVFVADCDTGQMLYSWKLGTSCEVSPDGRWVAGVLAKSPDVTMYRTADGGVERTLPGEATGYAGGCFSDDGRLFVLSRASRQISGYDVTGAAGERWHHDSRLIPRAWSTVRDRFIGLVMDADDGDIRANNTGQFVLGNGADGRQLAVLAPTGTANLPVGFGLNGAVMYLQSGRREVDLIRPLSVADVDLALQTPGVPDRRAKVVPPATSEASTTGQAAAQALPFLPPSQTGDASSGPVELDPTDTKALEAHVGSSVILRGTVTDVSLPKEGKSFAFVNFTGADKSQFTVYISAKVVHKFAEEKGSGFLIGLAGQTVTISGDLTRYTNPQTSQTLIEVVIAKLDQLTVLPAKP